MNLSMGFGSLARSLHLRQRLAELSALVQPGKTAGYSSHSSKLYDDSSAWFAVRSMGGCLEGLSQDGISHSRPLTVVHEVSASAVLQAQLRAWHTADSTPTQECSRLPAHQSSKWHVQALALAPPAYQVQDGQALAARCTTPGLDLSLHLPALSRSSSSSSRMTSSMPGKLSDSLHLLSQSAARPSMQRANAIAAVIRMHASMSLSSARLPLQLHRALHTSNTSCCSNSTDAADPAEVVSAGRSKSSRVAAVTSTDPSRIRNFAVIGGWVAWGVLPHVKQLARFAVAPFG